MRYLIMSFILGAGSIFLGVLVGVPVVLLLKIGFRDFFYRPLRLISHTIRYQRRAIFQLLSFHILISGVVVFILVNVCWTGWRDSFLKAFTLGVFSSVSLTISNISIMLPKSYSTWIDPVPLSGSENAFREALFHILNTTNNFVLLAKSLVSEWRREERQDYVDKWHLADISEKLKILTRYDEPTNSVKFSEKLEAQRRACLDADFQGGYYAEGHLIQLLDKFYSSCYEEMPSVAKHIVSNLLGKEAK